MVDHVDDLVRLEWTMVMSGDVSDWLTDAGASLIGVSVLRVMWGEFVMRSSRIWPL